ncbi:MAG TPA: hypothetical protein VHS56_04915 [Candidatus Cybelea sp.]|nr:hypothetical protein [Candidatus Cybelea sp.]
MNRKNLYTSGTPPFERCARMPVPAGSGPAPPECGPQRAASSASLALDSFTLSSSPRPTIGDTVDVPRWGKVAVSGGYRSKAAALDRFFSGRSERP